MKFVLILILSCFVFASDFFKNTKEGWFYYIDPPKNEKLKKEQSFIAKIPQDLTKLSAKDFRETLDKVRDISIMNPTLENMMQYKKMMAFASDQSSKFATNYKLASLLDDKYDYHEVGGGAFSANPLREQKQARDIAKYLSDNIVFVSFVKEPDSQMTQKQALANLELRKKYQMDARVFLIDDYPEIQEKLGIVKDVENFVFYKDSGQWLRIRRNLIDHDEFIRDFIFFEKHKNEFSKENNQDIFEMVKFK